MLGVNLSSQILKVIKLSFIDKDNETQIKLSRLIYTQIYLLSIDNYVNNHEINNESTIFTEIINDKLTFSDEDFFKINRILQFFLNKCKEKKSKINKDFSLLRNKKNKTKKWFTYQEAQNYCKEHIPHSVNTLRGLLKYIKQNKNKLDSRLHSHVHELYSKEWEGIGLFLNDRRIRRAIFKYKLDPFSIEKRKICIEKYLINYFISNRNIVTEIDVKKYASFEKLYRILFTCNSNEAYIELNKWIINQKNNVRKIVNVRYINIESNNGKKYFGNIDFNLFFYEKIENCIKAINDIKFTPVILQGCKSFDHWILNFMVKEILMEKINPMHRRYIINKAYEE